jgi:hypothetical protein
MQDDGCKCPDGFKGDGKHKCEGKRHFLRPINLSRSACLASTASAVMHFRIAFHCFAISYIIELLALPL